MKTEAGWGFRCDPNEKENILVLSDAPVRVLNLRVLRV